jgi:predicted dinucleotide-utilizing enzyme
MNVGIIGAGKIGATVGRLLVKGLSLDKRVMFRVVAARRYNSIRRGSRRAKC